MTRLLLHEHLQLHDQQGPIAESCLPLWWNKLNLAYQECGIFCTVDLFHCQCRKGILQDVIESPIVNF